MRWLGPGAHHDDSFAEKYARFRWTHTCVLHKRKVEERVRYAPTRVIRLSDGTVEECKTGTQICDGFWQDLRKNASRKGEKRGHKEFKEQVRLHH